MKKKILHLIGAIVIIALMIFNTQVITNSNSGSFTLSSLVMQAFADPETTDCNYCGGDGIYCGEACPYCSPGQPIELPGGGITCSGNRYGNCIDLFVYTVEDIIFFRCEATGDPSDSCSSYDEKVCNIVGGMINACRAIDDIMD